MSTNVARSWALLVAGAGLVLAGGGFYLASSHEETTEAASPVQPEAVQAANLPAPDPSLPVVKVWKSPTCGCCTGWIEHMRRAGFQVEVEDVADVTPYKTQYGIGPDMMSCHTSLIDGYAIEGHVPADDIKRLLAERPQIAGLAAPGMPVGSPGMEVPGGQQDRYEVRAFTRDGKATVWATHP